MTGETSGSCSGFFGLIGRGVASWRNGLDGSECDVTSVAKEFAVVVAVVLHSEIKSKYEECIGNITF